MDTGMGWYVSLFHCFITESHLESLSVREMFYYRSFIFRFYFVEVYVI